MLALGLFIELIEKACIMKVMGCMKIRTYKQIISMPIAVLYPYPFILMQFCQITQRVKLF